MESINIKTGIGGITEPSDNTRTFMLVFMAIIWRRVWITAVIYCEHNKLKITRDILLKALKYNIFSKAGIGNNLEPYIVKALQDGFLMPQFYEKNIYATRAVKLYKSAYSVVKLRNRETELQFLKKYAFRIFEIDDTMVSEVADETNDTLESVETSKKINNLIDISSSENSDSINDSNENNNSISDSNETENNDRTDEDILMEVLPDLALTECKCKLCELVNSWDIHISLIYSDDPFKNVIMKGLVTALERTQ